MKFFGFGKDKETIVPILDRRRFLFLAPAVVAASNLMPGHSIAHLLVPDHYKVMAEKFDELLKIGKDPVILRSKKVGGYITHEYADKARITEMTNDILKYGMKHFAPGFVDGQLPDSQFAAAKAETKELFAMDSPVRRHSNSPGATEELLRAIPERQVPVALARMILGNYKMPVSAPEMESWTPFVNAYSDWLPGV